MIGELGLLAGRTRSATVTATGDLWVLRIRRATFRRLLDRSRRSQCISSRTSAGGLWEAQEEMATR